MAAAADPSLVNSNYVLPPDYKIMTETAEVFTKALLLGMEPERNNFADDAPVEILPFEEALAYMRKRVPVDKETYYALNDKMRYRAFTVSRLADGDAVKHVQGMLSDALEEGSGLQKFLQMTEGQLADAAGMRRGAGWYYETVYRTNTSTAYNVGRAIAFEETPPIALELIGIDDMRQTEICHSLTVPPFRRPYGDPVWQTLWPPFHFNCRTTVRGIYNEAEIEDAGGPDKFYSKGTPEYEPDKGFGTYPVDKTDKWWDLTDAMRKRAKEYGIMGEFDEAREKLISDYDTRTPPSADDGDPGREIINEFLNRKGQKVESLEAEIDYVRRVGIAANNTKEFGSFVGADGTIIDAIEGTKYETPIESVVEKLKKLEADGKIDSVTFIHYHTSGCSFSFEDLNAMCGLRAIKTMELTTMNNGTYSMAISTGKVPNEERLTKDWNIIKKAIGKKLKSDIKYSMMSDNDKDILISRELSRILAGIYSWAWRPPL